MLNSEIKVLDTQTFFWTVIFMVKDQCSFPNHLKLNSRFLPLASCLMTSWHSGQFSGACQDDCGYFMTRNTSSTWLSQLDTGAFSPLIDCKLFWLDATLSASYDCHWDKVPTRCGDHGAMSVMVPRYTRSAPGGRCISRVHSLLTSVGLRRESRQSVVSWRSDSEDVTYSRSQPAKCNCAIMPWWQSMCVRLCQQFATKIGSHKNG